MNNNELTERYLYAVTKRLPSGMRTDVEQELAGLIADMLEERCGEVLPTEQDLRVVLTELGRPSELAAKYHPDQAALIPAPYYTPYKLVLGIVIAAACGGMSLALALGYIVNPPANVVELAIGMISGVLTVAMQGAMWVTIIFAILSRNGVKLDSMNDSLDNLPAVPQNRKPISRGEAIFSIVMSVIMVVVFLGTSDIICAITTINGEMVVAPVFDAAVLRSLWLPIALMGVAGIVQACVQLLERYRTKRLMYTTIACNAVSAVSALVWLGSDRIVNPQFVAVMDSIMNGNTLVVGMMSRINLIALGAIMLALVLDTSESIYSTLKK